MRTIPPSDWMTCLCFCLVEVLALMGITAFGKQGLLELEDLALHYPSCDHQILI